MVVSELRGEKIDIIPWNTEPARFVAKALSPARVREVYIDDETRDATVVVPDDQLALAIGKEGLNARLAARLTGWKIDIQSDTEFAQAEADAAFGGEGEDGEDFSGRCSAVLSNGKRCPNAALPGSKYCGVPAHQALATAAPAQAVAPAAELDEEQVAQEEAAVAVAEAEPAIEAEVDTEIETEAEPQAGADLVETNGSPTPSEEPAVALDHSQEEDEPAA
jgi:N utilization substance protein A